MVALPRRRRPTNKIRARLRARGIIGVGLHRPVVVGRGHAVSPVIGDRDGPRAQRLLAQIGERVVGETPRAPGARRRQQPPVVIIGEGAVLPGVHVIGDRRHLAAGVIVIIEPDDIVRAAGAVTQFAPISGVATLSTQYRSHPDLPWRRLTF